MCIRDSMQVAQGAEVSYDSLPVTIGTPSLTGIASGHPNRTELMMRSDNDAELKALGCTHNVQHIRNAMLFLAKFHLNNVGLTLNYGIPGQTMQSWHNSLHAAVIMQAGHITAEPLAVTDAEQSLRKEIEQAWYNADASYAKYRSAEAAAASARVAFAYEERKAEAGRSTVFDFNDAKTRMEKAEAEAVQAKYEFVFRSKILDFYRGKPLTL